MTFTKFITENFKCFKTKQSLLFATPKENLNGSGITYIVGANNSGKTTIIEGLAIKESHKIKSSERVDGSEPEFILFDGETIRRKCNLVRAESYTIVENPKLKEQEKFEIISSRRHWQSGANSNFQTIGQSLASSFEFQNRQNNIEVASELKTIEANTEKYEEFIKLVKRVIPEFTKFAVGYEDNEFIEYISGAGVRHKTELLGDGVITVIRILLQLYVNRINPLIIDEPELSLHPAAQKKLLKIISEYAQKRQIIISTHSPYFVNWECLKNGAVVNRVVKQGDKDSTIFSISDFSKYKSLITAANWQQPFLMDEVAKEIFFSDDGIIFLEGQEDIGLLKNELSLKDYNFFGYGVRGKDNFKFALTFAKDLGYKKACCILDKGESEDNIKKELESLFPEYKIIQWNKNDIRDKESFTTQEKVGYFTTDGQKKTPEALDDFNTKIEEIKNYLDMDSSVKNNQK